MSHTTHTTHIDLQIFAGAGSLVNATNGYVNSSTGSVTSFDSGHTLAPELKAFYDTELLENARAELIYAQFAKRQPLPKNHNGQVEWRKFNAFDKAAKLSEGVIPTGQMFGLSTVTGTIDQYGTYTAITDKLELRAYDDVILSAAEEMGASAAETQEKLIRDALYTGTNVMYCDKITRANGAAAEVTGEPGLVENATYHCHLTPEMISRAATKLKKDRAPWINGRYVAVIHPSVAHDLRQCEAWIESHKYAAAEELFNGEIGELHGVRFIEDVFAPVLKGADLASDSRTLKIDHSGGYASGTAITSVSFDGGTVADDALIGRTVQFGGVTVKITDNTSSTLTFASVTPAAKIDDNADIVPADYGPDDQAAYATYFFGKDAFAIIDPEGGALEMIVHDKGEIGGPLNQFSTVGYKFETNGATILYPERLLRVMSTSSYSATDAAN